MIETTRESLSEYAHWNAQQFIRWYIATTCTTVPFQTWTTEGGR